MRSAIARASATGDVTSDDTYLRGVSLTAGSDAATLTLRAGGSGGTVLLLVKAPANTTVPVPLYGALFASGVHATLTGTGPEASLVHG